MTHKLLKYASFALVIAFILNTFATSVAAADKEAFSDKKNIICISHRGDWHSYPENSAEAVKAAVQYGAVSVDVQITSDGKAVLMADDTTDRMITDADGKTVSKAVSDMTFDELTALYLRAENGGEDKPKTEYKVASLESAINAAGDTALIVNTSCDDFYTVHDYLKALGLADRVIFRFKGDPMSDIDFTTMSIADNYFGNYQGNIIFLATSAVKKSFASETKTIELGSKNGNGVLYDEYLMSFIEEKDMRAMVSMVGGRNGKRPDAERGWDDLITLGYTVIETDYPEQFNEYLARIESEKKQLKYYTDMYKATDIQLYTTDSENAFVTALNEAQSLAEKNASLSELQTARYNLQSAYDNLTIGEKKAVTLKFDFTIGRMLAVVLVGAAFVVSQILLFKRRDKNRKAQ